MTRKKFGLLLLPFLVALGLLSISEVQNRYWQKGLAHNLVHPPQKWFCRQSKALEDAQWQAGQLASKNCDFIVASVIFRNVNSWNSALWINKGYEDSAMVAKNSPVLSGDSVIGVIDYVGKRASCVRLISDSSLTPAVRVMRHGPDPMLQLAFSTLLKAMEEKTVAFSSEEEMKSLCRLLQKLKTEQGMLEPQFLAKGILQGHGEPLWKAQTALLKGYGFNYDFKDQRGPSRTLRSSDPPIIQVGDLLVTSGMDGIFPEGLKIARVHTIFPLTEGAYAYDILAEPTAQGMSDLMSDLQFVTILPPQDFDPEHLPDRLERIIDSLNLQTALGAGQLPFLG